MRFKATISLRLLAACFLLTYPFKHCFLSADESVNEILTKVSETYRTRQSFQVTADISTEVVAVGDIRSESGRATSNFHQSTNSQVELATMNPGKIQLEIKDESNEVMILSDGSTTWTYLPRKKQYMEAPSANPESAFLGRYRNILMTRYQEISRFGSKFVMERDNQIRVGKDRVDCYVLKMEGQDGTSEIWVDKNRFIVWRSRDSSPTAQEGISLRRTTTVNLKSTNMDTKLDDRIFRFAPPEKATRVQSLTP